jgi:hypothetical protein
VEGSAQDLRAMVLVAGVGRVEAQSKPVRQAWAPGRPERLGFREEGMQPTPPGRAM